MGTIGSNPSNPLYPAPVTPPGIAPSAPAATAEGASTPSVKSAAEASAEGAAADVKAPANADTTSTEPTTPDLKISKEMAAVLSSNQVQSLIDGILSDGTVDKLDDSKLKQLNILLDAAAKKNDGKVDETEGSLIESLDSRGMFGTNREVVKTNLQALKKHSGSANSLDFSGGIKLTTQDGVSGFFGGKQQRALTLIDIPEPVDTTNTATTIPGQNAGETPSAGDIQSSVPTSSAPASSAPTSSEAASNLSLDPLAAENTISRDARSLYHAETVNQTKANETRLKDDINYIKTAFEKLPDSVIQEDIKALVEHSDTEGSDLDYIKKQLENWKIQLPEGVDPKSPQDIKHFLAGYEPTPENVSAYRANINQVAEAALQETPLSGKALSDAKTYLYDNNYIFEHKEGGISEADYQRYSQFKTSLLDYQDSESKVRSISRNGGISTSNVEVDNNLLEKYDDKATTKIQQAATQLNNFLKQVETKPKGQDAFGVSNADIAALRNQLGDIVEVNGQGQMVLDEKGQPKVKQPITQEHLQTLNKVWASAEAIGIAAQLDQEPGEISEKFFSELRQKAQDGTPGGINVWNEVQKKPAGEILTLKPELAQYADLLKQIEANPALKAALFSSENPEKAVNQLLAEHNAAVFNDSFGSFSSLWDVGPTSFLTAWGCSLPGVQDLNMCTSIPSKTSLLDLTLPATLPEKSLPMSPLLSEPKASGKLELGKYTTQDVRALLDLLKDPAKLDEQSDEDAAFAVAKQQSLRAKLNEHSGEVSSFIKETPELAGLRQQLEAKKSFDNAFWGGNSDLDQARQGIKTLLEKQDQVGADLAVAEAQIKATLDPLPEGDLRHSLTEKLRVVQNAQAELKTTGKLYPQGDEAALNAAQSSLQSVMNSLNGKGIASDGRSAQGISQNLIADTQAEQIQQTLQKTLKTLAEINADPQQKQAVLAKFPEAQRSQVSNLLDNHTLLEDISKQMATDPSSIDPSTLEAFAFAGYMTELAQNGTSEQIQTALEGRLPGSSLKVSDALDHMDRLLTHVNSLGSDDGALKATYVTGLSAYFNKVFESGQSVDQAWQALDNKETMKNVQQGVLRGVYEDSGMSTVEVDALLAGQASATDPSTGAYTGRVTEKNKIVDDFLRNQQSTLTSIIARGGRTQGTYESLLMDYTSLESSRNPKNAGATPSYNEQSYQSLQTRLVDRENALSQKQRSGANFSVDERQELENVKGLLAATRASIETEDLKVHQVRDASGIGKANQLRALIDKATEGVIGAALDSEALVDDQSNQALFNQFVPAVMLPNGQPMLDADGNQMTGQAFVASMLGAGGATSENMGIFEANFGRLQDTREGELLYQKTLVQARSNEAAQLSHNVATSNSDDPNSPKIFAFGESLRVGQAQVNALINGPQGLEVLGAWGEIIQKHGGRLKGGSQFNEVEYARELKAFADRFGITDPVFLGYANSNAEESSFRSATQIVEAAHAEFKGMGPAARTSIEEAIQNSQVKTANALAAVTDPHVNVNIAVGPDFNPDDHPGFNATVETANRNLERTATERLDGLLAVEDVLNRDTARIVTEANESGDFSLLNQVQSMQAEALQHDMERSDAVRQVLSELTGTPFVPHSDRYRSMEGLGKAQGSTASAQKASELVEAANQLASRLSLTADGEGSEELLSDLVGEFLNVIRDQDYKTRQLVMAQLANQMMTDSITNFYKDKTDKNNKYHQDALDRMSDSFQQNIQRGIQDSLVNSAEGGDAQSVAAVSGQVGAANTAEAMGVAQLRASTEQLLSQAQQMEPPLLSDLQKERILDSLFDRNPDNDALGIMSLAGLQSLN